MYEELEKTFWKNGNDWQSQKKESKPYSSLREMQIKAAHYHLPPINYQKVKDQNICFNTYSISAGGNRPINYDLSIQCSCSERVSASCVEMKLFTRCTIKWKWRVWNNVLIVASLTIFIKQTEGYVCFICIDYFQNSTPISKTYFQLYSPLHNLFFWLQLSISF